MKTEHMFTRLMQRGGSRRLPAARVVRFLIGLVAVALLIWIPETAGTAVPNQPPVNQVVQVSVFDGAYQPSDVFGVAQTDLGLVAHIENAFTCPGTGLGTTSGFVPLGPAQ